MFCWGALLVTGVINMVWMWCRRTDNIARATECFQRSLQLNPFLWSSYESLCLIGNYVCVAVHTAVRKIERESSIDYLTHLLLLQKFFFIRGESTSIVTVSETTNNTQI